MQIYKTPKRKTCTIWDGDAFLTKDSHTSLSTGGGQAGQGYPCAIVGVDMYNQTLTGGIAKTITSGREDKDNIPCMYDKVTGKYFYNQGTGVFKWKLPNQLEYLECDGK